MSVTLLNPPGLPTPEAYAQLSIATGTRLVFISGQIARDADGQPVGDTLADQTEQVYANLHTAVTAADGSFAEITKVTAYVVGWTPDKMAELAAGAVRAAERLGFDPIRPITLVGVDALGEPDLLIEAEAIAVLA